MTLASVEAKIRELETELDTLKRQRHELLNKKFGVSVGDWVTVQGKKFKVASISHLTNHAKPWLKGFMLKKGGELSCIARNLYSEWEKTDAPEGH